MNLKNLKETIDEIYISKMTYDRSRVENKLPTETMEKHMYKYL
jgi:hypothetical protein